jgi:hypothetical protein
MGFWNFWQNNKDSMELSESIKAFANKGEKDLTTAQSNKRTGEGYDENSFVAGFGNVGLTSFNMFYDRYIDSQLDNEKNKIFEYRRIAELTEIADVVEDVTNESTQKDDAGKVVHLDILDDEILKNENIVNNIMDEFSELFYETLEIQDRMWDLMRTYFIDGRLYFERVINESRHKDGVIGLKKLPSESMDFELNPKTGKIIAYYQYLKKNAKRPKSVQEAEEDEDVIVFYPEQISFIDYGIYGDNKHDIKGYLEKARIPYNQLKLLETSVIIYRIVRAPERFVFRIDTGAMPMEKAMKFVEKVKQKMTKKQTYDPNTGRLSQDPEVLSILDNFYLPQSSDGRGSQIDTIGGNSTGFTELDDIYYFQRKLYRALKYPMSRVNASEEKGDGDILFGGNSFEEISRDEVKFAKFLERQQAKMCNELENVFLLHMQFKGLKEMYGLNKNKISVRMNQPSQYKEQMDQKAVAVRFDNYQTLADRTEMSKYFLMRKYLMWDDKTIRNNVEGFKKDKELGLVDSDDNF